MNALAHASAALCFLFIALAIMLLGFLEGAILAGFIGFIFMIVIAAVMLQRAEVLMGVECINRRHYKGKFN